jgi:hypothetical protein
MSVSCIGTCSHCGVKRWWLSSTLALQLDDGSLKCLAHPGESYDCEQEGLTLPQASERRRLFRETFYTCHHCGRTGEVIEPETYRGWQSQRSFWGDLKMVLILAAVTLPFCIWFRWWSAVGAVAGTIVIFPLMEWWKRRKAAASDPRRAFPRPDAPGQTIIAPPTRGSIEEFVVGHVTGTSDDGAPTATGPCCDQPDWRWAGSERDEDKIPCYACGRAVMKVSEHSIH